MNQRNMATQRGVTLVEASIALACFGLLMIMIIAMMQRQDAQSRVVIQDSAVHRAQAAITAFAAMHGRLPCPAPSADLDAGGTESCATTDGYLPIKTLGLPMAAAAQMRYRVSAADLQTVNSRNALVLQTAGIDLLKTMQPVALKDFVGDANQVGVREQNFCQALFDLGATTNQAAAAAYGLLPDADAHDEKRIQYTSGSSLWASLNCNQVRAHGLRANANVVAGMEFLQQSYDDRMKVWASETVAYGLDALASATWVAQGAEKLYRQSGNFLAAEGVVTCPYCAPSGAALVPSAAVFPMVVATEAPLIADAVKYSTQAAAYTAALAAFALPVQLSIHGTVGQTTAGYKTALKTGAQY